MSAYGGLAWCLLLAILTISVSALRQRKAARRVTSVIIPCLVSIVLLTCALIWYYFRFRVRQGRLADGELWSVLIFTLFFGWLVPLVFTCMYWFRRLRKATRKSRESEHSFPKQGKPPQPATVEPPHFQSGVTAPYVFGDDTPWGWLEYENGNFQGQRLALERALMMIGRDESCDIWLDDDMASRYHAELAYHQQQVCLTDCQSLNGVFLNGYRVHGTVQVHSQDHVQVGEQRFLFILMDQKEQALDDQYDPLSNHTWRSTYDLHMDTSSPMPAAPMPGYAAQQPQPSESAVVETDHGLLSSSGTEDERGEHTALIVRSGLHAGMSLLLDQPLLTIGRSEECTYVLYDESVDSLHVQIHHQPYGDYVQPVVEESEVSINNVPVQGAQLLRAGDMLRLGKILCEYLVPQASDSGMLPSPRNARSLSGPVPLRLPSRIKPS